MRLRAAGALLAVAALSAALGGAACAGEPDIRIFFSSDTRGMLRRCGCSEGQLGGLSARASYIKANRLPGRTLVVDAGDTFFDGPRQAEKGRAFYRLKAATIVRAMAEAGYDAAAAGEYDLALGPGFFQEAAGKAGFPFLAANMTAGKNEIRGIKGSIIKKLGETRVGIVAVVDDEFPYSSFPSLSGITVGDPVRAANEEIKKLRPKADLVVVLAHLSVRDEKTFAESLTGADVVIQGHSQDAPEALARAGGAILVKGFYKGKRIGVLDIRLDKDKKEGNVAECSYKAVELNESVPPDPAVEKIIAGYRRQLKKSRFVFAASDPYGAGSFTGPTPCRDCHGAAFRGWSITAHARAYSSLIKTADEYDPECLPCHTTGYGIESGYRFGRFGLMNVTCESCHGKGERHVAGFRGVTGLSAGRMPAVTGKACLNCHDDYNSPNFEFERYKALGGDHRARQGK